MTPKGTHRPIGRRSSKKTKRGGPQEKRQSSEGKLSYQKTVHQNNFKTGIIFLWLLKRFCEFHDLKYRFTLCVIVNSQLPI